MGRGQKLGDNAEAVPFSDMTVEDLLRIVRSLPPEESAVAAVSRGLFYLDSRAACGAAQGACQSGPVQQVRASSLSHATYFRGPARAYLCSYPSVLFHEVCHYFH